MDGDGPLPSKGLQVQDPAPHGNFWKSKPVQLEKEKDRTQIQYI